MEQMRKLPIGIQAFEKLREENYLFFWAVLAVSARVCSYLLSKLTS